MPRTERFSDSDVDFSRRHRHQLQLPRDLRCAPGVPAHHRCRRQEHRRSRRRCDLHSALRWCSKTRLLAEHDLDRPVHAQTSAAVARGDGSARSPGPLRDPTSSVPRSFASPNALAGVDCRATAASSAAVTAIITTHAMFIAVSSDAIGEVPGLQSVDYRHRNIQFAQVARWAAAWSRANSKTRRAEARDDAALRPCVAETSLGVLEMIGRQCATVGGELATVAIAQLSRRAVRAFNPNSRARSKMRRVCSGENAMRSQKTSTASASFAFATAGNMSSHTWRT